MVLLPRQPDYQALVGQVVGQTHSAARCFCACGSCQPSSCRCGTPGVCVCQACSSCSCGKCGSRESVVKVR